MSRLRYAGRCLPRTVAAFCEFRAGEESERAAEIAALPSKDWKGLTVYQMRCDGDYGRGPHEVWLPEYLLWGLIDLRRYRCPFHQ